MAIDVHADAIDGMARLLRVARRPRRPSVDEWRKQSDIKRESAVRPRVTVVSQWQSSGSRYRYPPEFLPSTPLSVITDAEFLRLAQQWREDTLVLSSVAKRAMHPSYQRIIGLGWGVVPLVLRELRDRPNHWFWALNALTGESPAKAANNFDEARFAWLQWGRDRGLIE
jgi:hypothetical protein